MTRTGTEHDDFGGASRFFYVAKASTAERNHGLGPITAAPGDQSDSADSNELGPSDLDGAARNTHPCVKPVALMLAWLTKNTTHSVRKPIVWTTNRSDAQMPFAWFARSGSEDDWWLDSGTDGSNEHWQRCPVS
jgi:hypothetical protein